MMKIIKVEIQEDGDSIQIETDRKDDFKFIWFRADELEDLAELSEHS